MLTAAKCPSGVQLSPYPLQDPSGVIKGVQQPPLRLAVEG